MRLAFGDISLVVSEFVSRLTEIVVSTHGHHSSRDVDIPETPGHDALATAPSPKQHFI